MRDLRKRTPVRKILAFLMVFTLMFATTAMAETKQIKIDEKMFNTKGNLEFSNVKSTLAEMQNKEMQIVSIDENLKEFAYSRTVNNAFTVNGSTKLILTLSEPMYTSISINKVTKRGDDYTYIYRNQIEVSSGEINPYDDMPIFKSGVTYDLTEIGDYLIEYTMAENMISTEYIFVRVEEQEEISALTPIVTSEVIAPKPVVQNQVNAVSAYSKVEVNGKEVEFDAYNIADNNYFKLRDIAYTLNGTEKQFGVEWDATNKAINLKSTTAYNLAGGEMAKSDGVSKNGTLSMAKIYKDGSDVDLKAYTINDNNYFKLRDLGKAFDIGVYWDGARNTIVIDTTMGYTE